jgi:hypothetical protein
MITILKESEAAGGTGLRERASIGGRRMGVSEAKWLRTLEEENRQLMQIVAEQAVVTRKW